MRAFFKILSLLADARALRKGPGAFGMRQVRRQAHRAVSRRLR